eukprot:scaffold15853_cov47-Prasinocladus_malaysianus.AAC.1
MINSGQTKPNNTTRLTKAVAHDSAIDQVLSSAQLGLLCANNMPAMTYLWFLTIVCQRHNKGHLYACLNF